MSHSFHAFIDESGDDGLAKFRQPGGEGGSSHWLVISALVIRTENLSSAIAHRDGIVKRTLTRKRHLHFADLDHGQKIVASQVLGTLPVRLISVVASKKHLQREVYKDKNQLYFYLTRYLVERLSWFCRDTQPASGNGKASITFSRRGGMSYDDFRQYLTMLRAGESSVHWPSIDIDSVDAKDHSRDAWLQLADIAASSFSAAIEPDRFGNTEARYASQLRPVTYKHNGSFMSYGIKMLPNAEECQLGPQQHEFLKFFGWSGRPPGP